MGLGMMPPMGMHFMGMPMGKGAPFAPMGFPPSSGVGQPGKPPDLGVARKWEEHTSPDGVKYYYDPVTKESTWQIPADFVPKQPDEPDEWELLGSTPWQRVKLKSGKTYFFNTRTKERVWDTPEAVVEICAKLDGTWKPPPEPKPAEKPATDVASAEAKPSTEKGAEVATSSDEDDDDDSEDEPAEDPKQKQEDAFFQMLREHPKVGVGAVWDKVLPQLIFDARFKAVPQPSRKPLFDKFMKSLVEAKRKVQAHTQRAALDAFRDLLDDAGVTEKTKLADLESSSQKWRNDKRWTAVGPTERSRMLKERIAELKKKRISGNADARKHFRAMLSAHLVASRDPRTGTFASWADAKDALRSDARYSALTSSSEREQMYRSILDELQKRAPKRSLDNERASEARKKQREHAASSMFINLLTEHIKNPWTSELSDHKEKLENSPHWTCLEDEERLKLWDTFVRSLREERLQLFRSKLTRAGLFKASSIAEALEIAASDRSLKEMPEEDLTEEFKRWLEQESADAQLALRKFLKESYNSNWKDIRDHGRGFDNLIKQLSDDVRYQRLKFLGDEGRRDMIREFLREERKLTAERAERRTMNSGGTDD
jgi:hypothetical protein